MSKLSDVYLFNIQKDAQLEKLTDSFTTATSVEELLSVSISGDDIHFPTNHLEDLSNIP